MNKNKLFSLVSLALILSGCTSLNVTTAEDGTHHTIMRSADKGAAEEAALDEAQEFCEKRHASVVVLKENHQYTGKMDEKERETIRNISRGVLAAGTMHSQSSHPLIRLHGESAKTAGIVGYSMTSGDDYVAELRFKCLPNAE